MLQQPMFPNLEVRVEIYHHTDLPFLEELLRGKEKVIGYEPSLIIGYKEIGLESVKRLFNHHIKNLQDYTSKHFTIWEGKERIGYAAYWNGVLTGDTTDPDIEFWMTQKEDRHQARKALMSKIKEISGITLYL